jgi:hypothetical protein
MGCYYEDLNGTVRLTAIRSDLPSHSYVQSRMREDQKKLQQEQEQQIVLRIRDMSANAIESESFCRN